MQPIILLSRPIIPTFAILHKIANVGKIRNSKHEVRSPKSETVLYLEFSIPYTTYHIPYTFLHFSSHIPFRVSFFKGFALVEFLFTLSNCEFNLDFALLSI